MPINQADLEMQQVAAPKASFVSAVIWTGCEAELMQGWAVNSLGHSPAIVADALAAQARLLLTPSPAFYNGPSLKFANALVANSCFDQVFFANSGGEANEGAIKLARKYGSRHKGGAYEIITFVGGFHGRTLATMSASGKKAFEPLFEPKVAGFRKARLNDLDSVKALITPSTVAVMKEEREAIEKYYTWIPTSCLDFFRAHEYHDEGHGNMREGLAPSWRASPSSHQGDSIRQTAFAI